MKLLKIFRKASSHSLLNSTAGLLIPTILNLGLIRIISKSDSLFNRDIDLSVFLELQLWFVILQILFFFGGNEFFSFLALNKPSKEKKQIIIFEVNKSLKLYFISIILIFLLCFFNGIQYFLIYLILFFLTFRTFFHHVLSNNGNFIEDYKVVLIDFLSITLILILTEFNFFSFDSAVILLIVIGLILSVIQYLIYKKTIIYENDDYKLKLPNKRSSYFFKELIAYFSGNIELFLILYFFEFNLNYFVEYNLIQKFTIIILFINRMLYKWGTVQATKYNPFDLSLFLRKLQLTALICHLITGLIIYINLPLLMKYFNNDIDYKAGIWSVLIILIPITRSFFTFNIYFNIFGLNNLLNMFRLSFLIIGSISAFIFFNSIGYIGILISALVVSILFLFNLLYFENKILGTIFFK